MERVIYFISGLATDKRIFRNIRLETSDRQVFLEWLAPEREESFDSYVSRMQQQIDESREIVLVGVSFGGMVAIELARRVKPSRVIIISSVKTRSELPLLFRIAGWLRLTAIVPFGAMKVFPSLVHYFFGTEGQEERDLLDGIIRDADIKLVKWSAGCVVRWSNRSPIPGLHHIQGTSDRLFPSQHLKDTIPVEGGTHLMVFSKGDTLSRILNQLLVSG
jgi:pimeloyl-ACP methyl ester carboxylesterase